MSALSLALVVLGAAPTVAPQGPALELEVDAAYGFGARSAFGALVGANARWTAWDLAAARGALELGLLGGYQAEPYGSPLLLPTVVSGATHRVEAFVTFAHTFAFSDSRRFEAGLALFAGVTHVALRGVVRSDAQGFTRASDADGTEFTVGAMVRLAVRLTPTWAVVGRFLAPLPYAGVAISSYFMASLGVGFTF